MEDRSHRIPTWDEIAAINATHFVETPLKPADLLFVFGTRERIERRVDAAVDLYGKGMFRWAIVSGGVTPGGEISECEAIKAAMVTRGMPASVILEEHRATNTGENVSYSMPIIDAQIGLANIRSVICLGSICTSRRYPMTLQARWPTVEKMLVCVNPFETPKELWHTNPAFRSRVLREWDKIGPYMERGFIADWPV